MKTFRRALLIAAVGAALVLPGMGTAQAVMPRPDIRPPRTEPVPSKVHRVYWVKYRSAEETEWKVYGPDETAERAEWMAERLSQQGYDVIVLYRFAAGQRSRPQSD